MAMVIGSRGGARRGVLPPTPLSLPAGGLKGVGGLRRLLPRTAGPLPEMQPGSGRTLIPRPVRPPAPSARRARLARRSEPFLLMAGACALLALLATLYLTEDNKAALMTYQINTLQNQQNSLLRTQGDLKLQLEQLESLQRIQGEASTLGMVPVQPTTAMYLDLPPVVETVAAPQALAQAQR